MIVVTGWPRSGTSLLMQVIVAGGLEAVVDPETLTPRPGNQGGLWEIPAAYLNPLLAVHEHLSDRRKVVKLFYPSLQILVAIEALPAAVVRTTRPVGDVRSSQESRGMLRASEEDLEATRDRALAWVEQTGVPRYDVPWDDLLTNPGGTTAALADFLEPFVGSLDRSLMAAVPDPDLASF